MAKKKTGLSSTLFGGIDPYGGEEAAVAGAEGRLPLAAIRPDPDQPRRLLPAALAADVAAGRRAPEEALEAWMHQLQTGEQAHAHNLRELRRLADSIARHGLINPITVRPVAPDEQAPAGVDYYVVTGERRYWAHVLLAFEERPVQEGESTASPEEIPATLTASGVSVRAHQLIENLMREDINAVEKARGLWALRYELSGLHPDVNYSSPRGDAEDVNDSSPPPGVPADADLVPWTRVSEEMAISNRYRIFLTNVLNLSPEAQALVEEHGLAEITIRPIVQKLRDQPELQVAALQQLVQWQEENEAEGESRRAITRSVKELVDALLTEQAQADAGKAVKKAAAAVDSEAQTRRFRSRVRSTLRFLHRMPEEEAALLARDLALDHHYANVVKDLHTLRAEIDQLLEKVAEYE